MSYSFVTYTGNGTNDTFAVPFDYIAKSHVKVYVGGVLQTVTTHYTWPTAASIQFTAGNIPGNGVAVRIERESSRATRLVNFSDAAQMTAADMNKALKQDFFMSQEAFDTVENSIALDTDDKYEANSKVIKNVADPVSAQDAATKAYGDANWGGSAAASAAASASAAATSATNAANSYDSFDDRYLGSKTSNPTLDNDGNALLTGALYWNSTANEMRVYTGSEWVAVGAVSQTQESFTATAGQTSFTITGGYTVGQIAVYVNGARLPAADFTASNGTSVVLGAACAANDAVMIEKWTPFSLSNAVNKTLVDAKGDLLVGTANDTVARKAVGSNGLPLVANSADSTGVAYEQLATGGIADAAVTEPKVAAGGTLKLDTPTTASGTEVEFTNIPAGTKQIILSFHGISFGGPENPGVQLGSAGGYATTGYNVAYSYISGAGASQGTRSSDFILGSLDAASAAGYGTITLTLIDATNHVWAGQGQAFSQGSTTHYHTLCAGTVDLAGELTKIKIFGAGSGGTLDGGTVNIAYK